VTTLLSTLLLVFPFAMTFLAVARAQDKPAAPPIPKTAAAVTPIRIQVVISRYQGDKRISSLPYALSVNSNTASQDPRGSHANLRMGARVPVMMMAPPTVNGKPVADVPTPDPFQYQDVGTNIDCFVSPLDDGRFRVEIVVDDSSIYADDKAATERTTKGHPTIRSFRASDSLILRDGGTAQFTTAVDKVSGEIVKVDLTLTVVK